jgi:hypothetical protein
MQRRRTIKNLCNKLPRSLYPIRTREQAAVADESVVNEPLIRLDEL